MADSNSDFSTTIGADVVLKGEIKSEKGIRLLGKFDGEITSSGEIQIIEGATLNGDVKAGSIFIDGHVKGNLTAKTKVQLAASAKLEGDLQAGRLEVAEGAILIGRCVIGVNGHTPGSIKSASSPSSAVIPSKSKVLSGKK